MFRILEKFILGTYTTYYCSEHPSHFGCDGSKSVTITANKDARGEGARKPTQRCWRNKKARANKMTERKVGGEQPHNKRRELRKNRQLCVTGFDSRHLVFFGGGEREMHAPLSPSGFSYVRGVYEGSGNPSGEVTTQARLPEPRNALIGDNAEEGVGGDVI
ncbi:hypothetical protein CW713_03270 [Methanophagales archaeon]|nr:MAG: hypothetical protein CW713_03270 [Methanophagales archaeon]